MLRTTSPPKSACRRRVNRRMTRVVILSAVLEVLILLGALLLSPRAWAAAWRPHPQPHRAAGALRRHDGRRQTSRPRCRPRTSSELNAPHRGHQRHGRPAGIPHRPEAGRSRKTCAKSELRTSRRRSTRTFSQHAPTPSWAVPRTGHSGEVIHITRALSDFFSASRCPPARTGSPGAGAQAPFGLPPASRGRYATSSITHRRTRRLGELCAQAPAQPLVGKRHLHGINRGGGGLITVTGREDRRLSVPVQDWAAA